MSRVSRSVMIAALMTTFMQLPARADSPSGSGVGVVVASPLMFASWIATSDPQTHDAFHSYTIVAFQTSDGASTRVVMVDQGVPFPGGIAPIDDVILPASALRYRPLPDSDLWEIRFEASLPTLGQVSLSYVTPFGFDGLSAISQFYDFVSPSWGVGGGDGFGNVYGTVDGNQVTSNSSVWGVDVYGSYTNVPLAECQKWQGCGRT